MTALQVGPARPSVGSAEAARPGPVGLWPQPPQRADRKLLSFGAPEVGSEFLSREDEPSRLFPGTNNLQTL